jgi:N-acetylneuraminic acid mutarotase
MRYFSGLIVFYLLFTNNPAFSQGYWKMMPPIPTERSEVAATELDGKIYVAGGFYPNGEETDKFEAFDTVTGKWQTLPPLPQSVHHTSMAALKNKIFVIGGFTGRWYSPLNITYEFDLKNNVWTKKSPMPTSRGALAAGVINGKIFVVGGAKKSLKITTTFFGLINTGANESYDPVTDTWEVHAPLPTPRDHLAVSSLSGTIYAFGGRVNGDYSQNLDANESYNPSTNKWKTNSPLPIARSGITSQSLKGNLFIFGGESKQGTFNQNHAYDPKLNSWKTMQPMLKAVHGLGSAVVGKKIHLLNGESKPGLGGSSLHQVFAFEKIK